MILADTSIWIDHLRSGDPELSAALEARAICVHPFLLGELACGNLRNRETVLGFLRDLPMAPIATDEETLELIERRRLMGRGIGYIDVHLLASTALAPGTRLRTRDRRLANIASELDLA